MPAVTPLGFLGTIADDFTYESVRRFSSAVAYYLGTNPPKRLMVFHDGRPLADAFARQAAQTLQQLGAEVFWAQQPTPLPVAAHAVVGHHADGGIFISGGTLPETMMGITFLPKEARPLSVSESQALQAAYQAVGETSLPSAPGSLTAFDPQDAYLQQVSLWLHDTLPEGIGKRGRAKVVLDTQQGAAVGYAEELLERQNVRSVHLADVQPQQQVQVAPVNATNALHVGEAVAAGEGDFGLLIAPDGAAFLVVDEAGRLLTPCEGLLLALYNLYHLRRQQGEIVLSAAVSQGVARLAQAYHQSVRLSAPGFWNLSAAQSGKTLTLAEPGRLALPALSQQPDGLLGATLVADLAVALRKGPRALLQEIEEEIGHLQWSVQRVEMTPELLQQRQQRLAQWQPTRLAGRRVVAQQGFEGVRIELEDGSWCYIRLLDPAIQEIYAEGPDEATADALRRDVEAYLSGRVAVSVSS
ncbi:MAG: hypothetical protein IMW91_05225 [Firmicutes bacterium]|nr:hypothetical protein [Bacillota bacterium]